ncbi:50S ribosomal protein L11 [Candidatus Woesearchaeota archaeon]|nr:50S ribosomal protein L11 [Candidatus Woesearchaeota archaeon]
MSNETIEMLVEGGKAVAGPVVGQKLGPLKINIQQVLQDVNKKTEPFKGMQVPIKLIVDTKSKEYKIEVGTPPTSELIKKELGLQKGSGTPDKQKVANISIEQCIKIAKMKMDGMYTDNLKSALKSVVGSCNSLGVLIEGKNSNQIRIDIDNGIYDNEINSEKTEPTEDKKKSLQIQLKEVQEKITKELEKLKAAEAEAVGVKEEKKEEVAGETPKEEGTVGKAPAGKEAKAPEAKKPETEKKK